MSLKLDGFCQQMERRTSHYGSTWTMLTNQLSTQRKRGTTFVLHNQRLSGLQRYGSITQPQSSLTLHNWLCPTDFPSWKEFLHGILEQIQNAFFPKVLWNLRTSFFLCTYTRYIWTKLTEGLHGDHRSICDRLDKFKATTGGYLLAKSPHISVLIWISSYNP